MLNGSQYRNGLLTLDVQKFVELLEQNGVVYPAERNGMSPGSAAGHPGHQEDLEAKAARLFGTWPMHNRIALDKADPDFDDKKDVLKSLGYRWNRDDKVWMRGRLPKAIALYEYVRQNNVHDSVLDGLMGAFKYDRTFFDKIVSSVGPLMEKLTTGQVAELLAPDYVKEDDPRPIFDWTRVIRQRGIVYVGLDALSDVTVASAVGNSMFADLASVAGELYKHGLNGSLPGPSDEESSKLPINIHADEFNELIGPEFIPIVNKAGGCGMQVTAYTQTWSDILARLQNEAKAGQVTGNFNTVLMLKVKEMRTAELLTDQLEQVELQQVITVSGVNDSPGLVGGTHFSSRNEDRITVERVPMLNPSEVMQLPKGHCFALINGGELWKVRLPLLDDTADDNMPRSVAAITSAMRRAYTTNETWHVDHHWGSSPDAALMSAQR